MSQLDAEIGAIGSCSSNESATSGDPVAGPPLDASRVADLMVADLSDGLDHPELWPAFPQFLEHVPDLPVIVVLKLRDAPDFRTEASLVIILAMCYAALGHVDAALKELELLSVKCSQSPLVQGAIFYLHGLLAPDDPRYRLEGKFCTNPFRQMDVLERSTHLCCASYLYTSVGDLSVDDWKQVWNSDVAQRIRASIHDGSYRYCNKIACPSINRNFLTPTEELASQSDAWRDIVENKMTVLPRGPESVNLAYDRTCNLSCPSCRTEKFAADAEMRTRFDAMQQRNILPLLRDTQIVFITGSGDPFASKNFRRLMEQLGPDDYPNLRFQVMTNGMLFTPKQWASFPALHKRVQTLKISIDAATGPTHELLRRGARWETMLENMAFAGELRAQGLIDYYELVFTVQTDNYREMGDACDLARRVGANGVFFARITNWGTFTSAEYRRRAVFLPSHPEHAAFLEAMQDDRLRDPMIILGDLSGFVVSD